MRLCPRRISVNCGRSEQVPLTSYFTPSALLSFIMDYRWTFALSFTFFLTFYSIRGPIETNFVPYPIASNVGYESENEITSYETEVFVDSPKIILFWTTYFESPDFHVGFGAAGFTSCPVSNCATTNNRTLLSQSDAVVMHFRNLNLKDLPTQRRPDQRWIFFNMESPAHLPESIRQANGMFNWTMTYRTDSDVAMLYHSTKWDRADSEERIREQLKSKSKLIAWFVSHCKTASKREDYVDQLKRFVQVDVYGKCGSLNCSDPSHGNDCQSMLSRDYKFYLSFENSVCRDYVTEKFFNALANYAVPVVYGGANYSQFAPSGSYIDVRDFETPKHLADYLNYLNENQTAYQEYFNWRKSYIPRQESPWCRLCEMLNNSTLPMKSYDIHNWFVTQAKCNATVAVQTSRPDISFAWQDVSTF